MLPIRHILFPSDFSDQSIAIAPYVRSFARQYGARITVLHVTQNLFLIPVDAGAAPIPVELPPERLAQIEKALGEFAIRHLADFECRSHVAQGEAAAAIVKYARTEKVDLIVMPTHGYGPFRRFLLGSVTAKVLHDLDCPILTGAHIQPPSPRDVNNVRRILCTIGLEPHSRETLSFAGQLASDFHAELDIVHAMDILETELALSFYSGWETEYSNISKAKIHKLMSEAGVAGEVHVKLGRPSHIVCNVAKSIHCDLLVVGRSNHNEGLLHGDAYELIRESPCPVVSA